MRIGIDVRYLSHGLVGGVHTYMKQFIPALIEQAEGHELVLYADTKRPFELESLPSHVRLRLLPYRNPLSSIANDLFMHRNMEHDQLDIAHFAGNYGFAPRGVKSVVTLQDEINLMPLIDIFRGHNKHPRTIAMMSYLHICTRAAVKRADLIFTVSNYSKRQICKYGNLDPSKILTAYHACPDDIERVTDPDILADVRMRLGLKPLFVLAEAFKNPAVLVRAWKRLSPDLRANAEIVFFSRSPNVLPVVHEAIDLGIAQMFIRPARSDLRALYSMAATFVFPSWIEGFGIPLVEAMTCGAPVIASSRGSIPEVLGSAGMIIDAEDDVALAAHLHELLTNPEVRNSMQQRGYERAKSFSWQSTATRTVDAYQRLLSTSAENLTSSKRQEQIV